MTDKLRPATTITIGAVILFLLGGIGALMIFRMFPGAPTSPPATLVETRPSTPLGLKARSVNGRIQPRGRPTTYWFEFGETAAYGRKTEPAALPPRIGAYYRESWDDAPRGWAAGVSGLKLNAEPAGGQSGGYVWYGLGSWEVPNEMDQAHVDGIGANFLAQYAFTSDSVPGVANLALAGGGPDFRGAKITCWVRGASLKMRMAELVFWLQSAPRGAPRTGAQASNWAYTGSRLTDHLLSGNWERASYVLDNDTNAWTYAGHNPANGAQYFYIPLDQVLGELNLDMFHMLVLFEVHERPYNGRVHFDEFEGAYRNASVLVASNGGRLISSPPGMDPPDRLTDGWRNGPNHTWRSASPPAGPLEFTYKLAKPVAIETVQIHQDPERPSKDVEVLTSTDGVTFTPLVSGVIPENSPDGPNFAFLLEHLATPVTASWVRVLVRSGYQSSAWGLGEIEVFGEGAVVQTDDDWYGVTADLDNLTPGTTYHWRLAAQSEAGVVFSSPGTFTVPADDRPVVTTLAPSHLAGGTALFEGRIDPMGLQTHYRFEYGLTTAPDYDLKTVGDYGDRLAGMEITPRLVTHIVEGLIPGKTYRVRLVGKNATGEATDAGVVFTAK